MPPASAPGAACSWRKTCCRTEFGNNPFKSRSASAGTTQNKLDFPPCSDLNTPADHIPSNVVINNCIINSSCNGIRLIGPAAHLVVDHCLFYGPGRQPHRTSNRRNMLSGINLQPGAWDKCEGLVDHVLLANNTMKNVASPLTLWARPGNPVGRVSVAGLQATGVYHSALALESWSEAPITNVVLRDVSIDFNGGGTLEQARQRVGGPGVDVRPLPAWGLYARNLEKLVLDHVRLRLAKDDLRPVLIADGVQRLDLDDFIFTRVPGVAQPLVTTNVGKLNQELTSPR